MVYEKLCENGIEADFSIFPGSRAHGGLPMALDVPHRVKFDSDLSLIEFPMSVGATFSNGSLGLVADITVYCLVQYYAMHFSHDLTS